MVRLTCALAACSLMIPCANAQREKMVKVDDTFDGREVTLQLGETLEVSLSENASTGHQWSISRESQHKFVPTLREREETVDSPDGAPGSSGVRHLYFEAAAAGTAELDIQYRRSWESNKPPARKFRLIVLVQSPPGR